jgi:4-nitrophenyl phosphatase
LQSHGSIARPGAYRAFLLDIDGTVVEGARVLSGAPELLAYLRQDGRRFLFLSNNSRSWPAEVADSLTTLGLRCGEEEVLTAGHLAALRAAQRSRRGVYVLGSSSLAAMVVQAGGRLTDTDPDVVLVGLDKDLSYQRLSIACRAVGAGARVVAVNRDLSNPTEAGLEPGAGVLLGAIRTYLPGRTLVCGKPSPVLAREAQRRLRARRQEMLMIGDSPIADMRMAQRAGISGALVETGVGAGEGPGLVPGATFAFATLGDLLAWLRS